MMSGVEMSLFNESNHDEALLELNRTFEPCYVHCQLALADFH